MCACMFWCTIFEDIVNQSPYVMPLGNPQASCEIKLAKSQLFVR